MAKLIDFTMLAMTTGREHTEEQHRERIEGSRLKFRGIGATPTPISLVVAEV
jgi:hypothetical protein